MKSLPLLLAALTLPVFGQHETTEIPAWHFTPPAGSGVVNVRDYGAKGDGATDDTHSPNDQ